MPRHLSQALPAEPDSDGAPARIWAPARVGALVSPPPPPEAGGGGARSMLASPRQLAVPAPLSESGEGRSRAKAAGHRPRDATNVAGLACAPAESAPTTTGGGGVPGPDRVVHVASTLTPPTVTTGDGEPEEVTSRWSLAEAHAEFGYVSKHAFGFQTGSG